MKVKLKGNLTIEEYLNGLRDVLQNTMGEDELLLRSPTLYVEFTDGNTTYDFLDKKGNSIEEITEPLKGEHEVKNSIITPFLKKSQIKKGMVYEEVLEGIKNEDLKEEAVFVGYHRIKTRSGFECKAVYDVEDYFGEENVIDEVPEHYIRYSEVKPYEIDGVDEQELYFHITATSIHTYIDLRECPIELLQKEEISYPFVLKRNGNFFGFSGKKRFMKVNEITKESVEPFIVGYTVHNEFLYEVVHFEALLNEQNMTYVSDENMKTYWNTRYFSTSSWGRFPMSWKKDLELIKKGIDSDLSVVYGTDDDWFEVYPLLEKTKTHLAIKDYFKFLSATKLKRDEISFQPIGITKNYEWIFGEGQIDPKKWEIWELAKEKHALKEEMDKKRQAIQ